MHLAAGQSVSVSIPDCDGLGPDGESLPRDRFESRNDIEIPVVNPTAGPYFIEGADVGDTICVHIEEVTPDRDFGRTGISSKQVQIPQRFFLTEDDPDWNVSLPKDLLIWDINRDEGIATFHCKNSRSKEVHVELNPFPGCIAVSPPNGQFCDGLTIGPFGGNMDVPLATAGRRIYLPVFMKGANLFIGDLHAAQGHGEVIGGAIEISGRITFRTEVLKNQSLRWPRIEDDDSMATVVSSSDIKMALQIAYAQMVLWLAEAYGYDRWDALNLVSQTARAGLGNSDVAFCELSKKHV
jgi:acetamidase/formamidase